VSKRPGEDSIADKLEGTDWDYSQSEDRRFLFEPIGKIFGTFRWDGEPERRARVKSTPEENGKP
jgi:hypothetical protein